MTKKNREMLRAFDDEQRVCRLLQLPLQAFKALRKKAHPNTTDFATAQAALCVSLLPVAPIRAKNLASSRIGHNLITSGGGSILWATRKAISQSVPRNNGVRSIMRVDLVTFAEVAGSHFSRGNSESRPSNL